MGVLRLVVPFCMHRGAMYDLWQSGHAVSQQPSNRMSSLDRLMSRKTRKQIGSAAPAACAARPAHPYLTTDTDLLSSYLLCCAYRSPPTVAKAVEDGRGQQARRQDPPNWTAVRAAQREPESQQQHADSGFWGASFDFGGGTSSGGGGASGGW